MPLILPSERRLVKPSGRIVLNKDSPQAVGLVAWFPFGFGVNAVDEGPIKRYHLADVGSPAFVFDKERGRVVDLATASSQRFNTAITPITTHPATLTCWHMKDNSTDVTFLIQLYNSADTGQFMALMARATQEMRARKDGQTGNAQNADDSPGYTVGSWDFGAAIFASSSSMRVKANRRASVSNSTDTGVCTVDGICIGAEMFTTPRSYYGGLVDDVRVYNRALSDAELDDVYDPNNRFELYYELGRRSYFFPHPAGGALQASATIAAATADALAASASGSGSAPVSATIASAASAALDASVAGTGTAGATAGLPGATGAALDASAAGTGTAAASASLAIAAALALDAAASGTGTASVAATIAVAAATALDASGSVGSQNASATAAGVSCDALPASASGSSIAGVSATIAVAAAAALDAVASGAGTQVASASIAIAAALALDATAVGAGVAQVLTILPVATASALNATASATGAAPAAAGLASASVAALNASASGVGVANVTAMVAIANATALSALVSVVRTLHVIDFVLQRVPVIDFHLTLGHRIDFEM